MPIVDDVTELLPTPGASHHVWGTRVNAIALLLADLIGAGDASLLEEILEDRDRLNRVAPTAIGADGQVLGIVGGVPTYTTPTAFGQRFDVRKYGAALDGATDDLGAFMDAAADAIAAEGHVWWDGPAAIDGPIEIDGSTVVGFGLFGSSRGGSQLIQLADNAPMIAPNLTTQGHSWGIGNFTATWDNPQDASDTLSTLLLLDNASGNFYHNWIGNITLSNAYRLLDTDGQLFWGNTVAEVMATSMYGGLYRLNGSAGQPNNRMIGVYLGAQHCTQTLMIANALAMLYVGCEINQVSLGQRILSDSGGGKHVFAGEFSVEGGAWSTANLQLFELSDSTMLYDILSIEGTFTQPVRYLYTLGSGRIAGRLLRDAGVPSGSGRIAHWHVGGTLSDPTANVGRNEVDDVKFFGSSPGWVVAGTNKVTPTDMDNTAGADAGVIKRWMDDSRVKYHGDADYTMAPGAPRKTVFRTPLTANRSVFLPNAQGMVTGQAFEVIKDAVGGDLIVKSSSGGTTFFTIANATKGSGEVTFNRSLTGGPSLTWSRTDGGTWT